MKLKMRTLRNILLCSAGIALLVVTPIHAQQSRGTVSGVVQAPDGTPQAKARVFLQAGSGRAPHTTLTDADGHYRFPNLRPGLYEVKAQANGNWSELQRNINVRANQDVNVDLKLAVPEPAKPKTP